ncbi:hypothetical protein [Polynucleobacter brandtiae]|nr:hypothetical protein [Polynucleobacter brandtiae]
MNKYIWLVGPILMLSSFSTSGQSTVSLNLLCQINGEITSMAVSGVTTVPIKDTTMSILVEKGVISISDGQNYFSNKMRAAFSQDTIFASDEWKQGDNDNRKQYLEINRNTGMVRVTKDITFENPTIVLSAKASGNCEKLANKKKF